MSAQIDDGGPAYPCHTNPLPGRLANAPQGMTLRDWFAGQALAGHLAYSHPQSVMGVFIPETAKTAYELADAMIEARKGGKQ